MATNQFDVIVIGGGPAGSTAASLLAGKGWTVCLLEKACHPRFHIGESLLPMNLPILEQLGVLAAVEKIGVKKYAAEFNSPDTLRPLDTFYFSESLTQNPPYAYQVLRSEFDYLLLNNSRKKGVTVIENITVTDVNLDQEGVNTVAAIDSQNQLKHYQSRYVIDASGRDTFLSSKLKLKRNNPQHRMAAIYGHFNNVTRRSGKDQGNISIYWFKHGWLWMIPLPKGVMSVGAVCWPDYMKTRTTSLDEFLTSTIAQIPEMAARMQQATPVGKVNASANYSYSSTRMHGDGYIIIGDAYAFVDPVFSSGVYLAMRSAVLGSELVDSCLRNADEIKQVTKAFETEVKIGIKAFSWFIYRFNAYSLRHLLMHNPGKQASTHFKMVKAAVISVFSGDIFNRPTLLVPLLIFKINYYLLSVANAKKNLVFWQRRLVSSLWKTNKS